LLLVLVKKMSKIDELVTVKGEVKIMDKNKKQIKKYIN